MRARAATLLAALLICAPGCISLHDAAGVPVNRAQAAAIVPGRTTRAETLSLMGPPTGTFSLDLIKIITQLGDVIELVEGSARVDDDIFVWQQVDVTATVTFFPLIFLWVKSAVKSRTLIVFFDDHGVVRYSAYRADEK